MTTLICTLLLAQGVPTDKEAEAAVAAWRAAVKGAVEEARIAALRAALETPHEKVIKAVAEVFTADTEKVRLEAAALLAEVDHPASADALVAALQHNFRRPEVLKVLVASFADLEWQRACPALEGFLARTSQDGVLEALPELIELLGRLGSVSSIGPLASFVDRIQGAKKSDLGGERRLEERALVALASITGQRFRRGSEYEEWWRTNGTALKQTAHRYFWLPKTHERVYVGPFDKPPSDALLVSFRITEPAVGPSRKDRKKLKKDQKP